MLRHAVAIFFWASALFVFIVSLRGELLSERERRHKKYSAKH
jgi:hypothetical protein